MNDERIEDKVGVRNIDELMEDVKEEESKAGVDNECEIWVTMIMNLRSLRMERRCTLWYIKIASVARLRQPCTGLKNKKGVFFFEFLALSAANHFKLAIASRKQLLVL